MLKIILTQALYNDCNINHVSSFVVIIYHIKYANSITKFELIKWVSSKAKYINRYLP